MLPLSRILPDRPPRKRLHFVLDWLQSPPLATHASPQFTLARWLLAQPILGLLGFVWYRTALKFYGGVYNGFAYPLLDHPLWQFTYAALINPLIGALAGLAYGVLSGRVAQSLVTGLLCQGMFFLAFMISNVLR